MRILRAKHLGMCFGVRDAIALAQNQAQSGPLTILGDLVHNQTVIDGLQSKGVRIVQHPEEAATRNVMVAAHGASDRSKARARALGLNVSEATCPLVHLAHRALDALVRQGFHPVVIGKRGHVEVRGLTEDLNDHDVVLSDEDVWKLRPHARIGVVAQTTQPMDRVRHLVGLLRQRFPHSEVRFTDTVCRPTKQRQHAAVDLAQECDVVVVIGGANSNNTQELVRTCGRYCARVHHVQTGSDLRAEWCHTEDTVGITAGTSTPDAIIDEVESHLRRLSAGREAVPGHKPEAAFADATFPTTLNHS